MKFSRSVHLVFSSVLLLPLSVQAQTSAGLEVGARAPELQLNDQRGNQVNLEQLLETGNVAVVFHRSANW